MKYSVLSKVLLFEDESTRYEVHNVTLDEKPFVALKKFPTQSTSTYTNRHFHLPHHVFQALLSRAGQVANQLGLSVPRSSVEPAPDPSINLSVEGRELRQAAGPFPKMVTTHAEVLGD